MDRRKSIGLIGAGSLLLAENAFPSALSTAWGHSSGESFMKAFAPRWEGMRMHTFEVFEAMPEEQFSFQPTEEVMSFAKLFSHVAVSLDYYAEILDETPHLEETESVEKGVVSDYLQGRFERFENALTKLNPEDLYNPTHKLVTRLDGDTYLSDYEVLMLAYNHTVHHKGQATTYLRLKEIAPPQYRF